MKTLINILCVITLFSFSIITNQAEEQKSPFMTNVHNRQTTTLNGKWQAIIDLFETGYYDYRYRESKWGFFKNAKMKNRWDLIEYDFDTAGLLNVPGDWNSQNEKLFYYEGTIWYKKDFDYDLKERKRLFVYFGAANYHAIIYLNGKKLGEHIGGFTPFEFEITDKVKEKDNFLILKVDNKRHADAIPTLNSDWWNYGGITRNVALVETPQTTIRDYKIQLKPGTDNIIKGYLQLDGEQKEQDIQITIEDTKVQFDAKTNSTGHLEFEIKANNLELWSPENPQIYTVNISSDTDEVTDQIGFRSIETKGHDILLNGKPIFLRGICIHEQAPMRIGRAVGREDALVILNWAKELGCNFVRLAHYPHNEQMVRLAEEMGLLVWSEVPVYWTINWTNQPTFENAKNQIMEMIQRDQNRAAIIIWSVANETPLSDERLEFLTALIDHARELDSTRLISAALERHYINKNTQMIDDPLGEYLDVIGVNEYIGWYDGLPEKADNMNWEMVYEKPLIISEFGAGALQGYHGDELTRWTEEYQEDTYRRTIQMLDKVPFLRGMTPWILADFLSPRRPLPNIQDNWNRKGLVSDRGIKKKAFHTLQNYYQKKSEE